MQFSKIKANLKYDLPAGIVVFLIAVPLCLGIALASGAPLFSGMISGIIGGIVIGTMSSSHTSVSGPAAGLAAVVLVAIQTLGNYEAFLLAVMLAGVFQIALGFARAGSIADYFPSSVIKGMLTAIGIIIILKQIPHALGYDHTAEGEEAFFESDGSNTFSSIWAAITQYIHPGATLVALAAIGIILMWDKPFIKKRLPFIPGALVAVIMSVLANELLKTMGDPWAIRPEHLVTIPVANNMQEFLGQFTMPDFTQWMNPAIYTTALTICIVASVETLLSIEAVDRIDPQGRITNTNKELKAQGIGNLISGLIGGLPITSVIVRSSANIDANSKSKVSAIFHGTLILVCVAFIPTVLNLIPLAALAAILILTGYKLAKPKMFKAMYANGKYQWWPFIITVVAVVFTDLLTGVGIGLAASVVSILLGNMKNAYYFKKEKYHDGDIIHIHLSQEVSFLNKAGIKHTLDKLPENSKVLIDAGGTAYIDFDVLEIIREFTELKAANKNIQVRLRGFKDEYAIGDYDFVEYESANENINAKAFEPKEKSVLN
ncbi:MAG: SulP family inorganic anion transporter [Saprospiraceae bacterium]|nr:SulP family inorganic anion transporter [Saprospiraceae bacterium]